MRVSMSRDDEHYIFKCACQCHETMNIMLSNMSVTVTE